MMVDRSVFVRDGRLKKVDELVRCSLDRPIRLVHAAAAAGLESRYFSAYFRIQTGVRFRDWLAALRVDAAKELLSQSDLSIWQVSQRVGLDERTLRRRFKSSTGLTPTHYRRSLSGSPPALQVANARKADPKQADLDVSELFLLVDAGEPCAPTPTTRKLTGPTRNPTEETRSEAARFGRDRA